MKNPVWQNNLWQNYLWQTYRLAKLPLANLPLANLPLANLPTFSAVRATDLQQSSRSVFIFCHLSYYILKRYINLQIQLTPVILWIIQQLVTIGKCSLQQAKQQDIDLLAMLKLYFELLKQFSLYIYLDTVNSPANKVTHKLWFILYVKLPVNCPRVAGELTLFASEFTVTL